MSNWGISAAGTVDADALPASEMPSPAPTAVRAAVFDVEAFLTMVAYSRVVVKVRDKASVRPANAGAQVCIGIKVQNKS